MAKKYYAVRAGKVPGVYLTWDECRANVHGFPGAIYKSFPTIEEAKAFAGADGNNSTPAAKPVSKKAASAAAPEKAVTGAYAFVDGSFNIATGVYGFGGFLVNGEERHVLQGSGKDPDMASMRNVAGEILGSQAAIAKALELGLSEVSVYYDYMGIEMWASGAWKRNKKGTIAYYDYIQSVKDRIDINFVKVKGHSGVDGNEEADRLAKEAAGVL